MDALDTLLTKGKTLPYLKKTLKIIMWVIVGYVLLLIVIGVLVQIPAVQLKLTNYATSIVSNKTHTKVEIKKVNITFPKSIVIEGLYLEDSQKDTLIFAERIKVNIALIGLLSNKITISYISLYDATINLYNTKTEPLLNYNFLIAAFNDSTKVTKVDTIASKWVFNIDKVNLRNLKFTYNDEFAGMNVAVSIQNSELSVDEIDLKKSVYKIDDMLINGLIATIMQNETTTIKNKNSKALMPIISAKKLQIKSSVVSYIDSVGSLSVFADIDLGNLKKMAIDLQKELINADHISLTQSDIRFRNFKPEINSDSISKTKTSKNNWIVGVNSMLFNECAFAYNVGDKPELKYVFDSNHINFSRMNLAASNFNYSSKQTKIEVKKFSAVNHGNFVINRLETDFIMDEQSITTNNLTLITPNSTIDADFSIQYTSMEAFSKSFQFSNLNLDLRNVSFKNPDVLYFNKALSKQPFFQNNTNVTTVTGKVNGSINHLVGKNLVVKTGSNTKIETDFEIVGLSNMQTASFDFPSLKIQSGKEDIQMMSDSLMLKNIDLPEKINMQIAFKGKLKQFETTVNMSSGFGNADLKGAIDLNENFSGKFSTTNLDMGKILKDTLFYGPVTLNVETSGHGLSMETITAKIKAEVTQLFLNQYTYHNLKLDGTVRGKLFEGKINLKDENIAFVFDGLVNLNPNQEQYKFRFNLEGANLQKLNFTKEDTRIGLVAVADLKGGKVNKLNGKVGISTIQLMHKGATYKLDSVLFASINESKKSEFNFSSALIGLKYSGTLSPADIKSELTSFINNYFPISTPTIQKKSTEPQNFNFEIQLHNHPILSEVLFPQLKEFETGVINGSFDSQKSILKIDALMKKIIYGTTELNNFAIAVNSDVNALNYKISCSSVSNAQLMLENFLIDGKLADQSISTNISSIDKNKNKKIVIHSKVVKEELNYKLTLDPKEFYLMNNPWNVAADNFIEFGKQGVLIHNFFINSAESQLNISSVNNQFNDDLNIGLKNFKLDDISRIVEKDSSFVKGIMNGFVLLKRANNTSGIIADLQITNLFIQSVPFGNLSLKASNPTSGKYDIDLNLSGSENNLTAIGSLTSNKDNSLIDIKTTIKSLSMKPVETFSFGHIREASGSLSGDFEIKGNTKSPEITGELVFNNAFITPAIFNNRLQLKHETIELQKDGIHLNSFTILDKDQHKAIIDGTVLMKQFSDFKFALKVNTADFLLFNTTSKDNKQFFGKMIIDSHIGITGSMELPVIDAKLKMKKGSNFTFAVSEEELTTDKGEDVVEFEDSLENNSILYGNRIKEKSKSRITGFDVSSIIEIDKQATLRLLMDPSTSDSLVVKGEAALSFAIDKSGKMSLTGAYNLAEGSYLVSFESIIKRKFVIEPGGTIIWNGDPLSANVSINAIYSVRCSPIDLIADQMAGLSQADKNAYKLRYPFLVKLKLRGEILKPEISFEIQLKPEDKGILNGAVNAKLNMLNEDPSALNKQVFALLVLGRFIQENPLQSESSGVSVATRATVSKLLSAQLNQLSSKLVPGVELNFDVQSYEDYQSGQAEGRTQVNIGVKKQLFNERLSVQVGGIVDVEGENAKQNSASDITSDVTLEYKITKDGRFRLKGFRHNQYEGAIEGQLVETGVGLQYVLDFDKWKYFFKTAIDSSDSTKKTNNNEKINHK